MQESAASADFEAAGKSIKNVAEARQGVLSAWEKLEKAKVGQQS